MKKKLIYLGLWAAMLLSATSCESVYDYGDSDRIDYDQIFDDYTLTKYYLSNCYTNVQTFSCWSMGNTFAGVYTDEAQDAQDVMASNASKYYNGEMISSNILTDSDLYEDLYEGIKHCNIFLENLDNVEVFTYEQFRDRWRAEVYLLRGYYHWQLIKHYGPMPIIKEVLPVDYDYSTVVRPTFQECIDEIIADCEKALSYNTLLWRIDDSTQSGTFTAGIAYAIMSQATLFAASTQWNPDNDLELWQTAVKYSKLALDELPAYYSLYETAQSLSGSYGAYQDLFLSAINVGFSPGNTEYIQFNKNSFAIWDTYGLPCRKDEGVTKAGVSPSQELVDAYETLDGEPILDLEQPYLDADHLVPNYNHKALKENGGMYDPENPYENRDQRMRSTVYVNGDYHDQDSNTTLVETFVGGNCGISTTSNLYTRTGYYLRKFINWNDTKTSESGAYWAHLRMAEMYLNYAEALLESEGATAEAYEAVNKIRRRAGQPDLPAGLSTDEFRLRLRAERRVEFAFEEHRYYDLRRWLINQDYEGVVTGMQIEKQTDDSFTYTRIPVSKRNVTDEKYRLFPVPLAEQLRFENVGVNIQNPGW